MWVAYGLPWRPPTPHSTYVSNRLAKRIRLLMYVHTLRRPRGLSMFGYLSGSIWILRESLYIPSFKCCYATDAAIHKGDVSLLHTLYVP